MLSIWEPVSRVSHDWVAAVLQWCELLTDTQRLLLPTSLAVVVLLWTKMCPPPVKAPSASAEDEAIYSAAIERWLASSAVENERRGAAKS